MVRAYNIAVRMFSTILWVAFGMSIEMVLSDRVTMTFSLWLLLLAFIVELWT